MTPVAVVTGAARGIGAATIQALAADGWALVAVDRCADDPRLPYRLGTEAELRAVAERASSSAPEEVAPVVADASDPDAIGRAVEIAEERFGGLDAIVAAAGVIAGGAPLWELPADHVGAVVEGNLASALATARAGVPALLRRPAPRRGRFLAVSSAAAVKGMPGLTAYCAAKAGIDGLVRGLAAELRGTGVTANSVRPGSTRTPLLEESARLYALGSADDFAAQQPLERLIEPGEVAAMLAFLAGSGGAAVTGASIAVDGGLAL